MPKVLTAPAMSRCIGCYSCMLACARLNYGSYSPRHAALQIRTQGGLQGRLVADICRACAEPACAEACPTQALKPRAGGGVRLDEKECIGCRACVQACPLKVIYWSERSRTPIVCRQCGICVRYCPHDCLAMEEAGAAAGEGAAQGPGPELQPSAARASGGTPVDVEVVDAE